MEPLDSQTGITVTGTGRVAIEPQIATLQAGVSLEDRSLEAARAAAASKITAARDHLLGAGVEQRDINTSRLNVHTSYDRSTRRRTYHLSTALDATIRDLDSAQSITNELFTAIGDGLDMRGLTFGIEDPTTGRDEAMELAFEDAKHKAVHLARLAGVGLGPVLAIVEADVQHGAPMPMMRSAVAYAGGDIPIEAGELDRSATLTVRWAIED